MTHGTCESSAWPTTSAHRCAPAATAMLAFEVNAGTDLRGERDDPREP